MDKILSIVIPVYNQEDLILRALNSIPTRKDIEVIVVDDASEDSTTILLQSGQKSHKSIKSSIITFQSNKGNCVAKNRGYKEASGKYIIVLDSDDYFYTDIFDETIDRLYNIDSDIIIIDNKVNNGEIWDDETRVAPWSYFIKKEFGDNNNLQYDETLRRAGDWHLMQEINKINHSINHIHKITYHYNYPREGSIVGNYEHSKDSVK